MDRSDKLALAALTVVLAAGVWFSRSAVYAHYFGEMPAEKQLAAGAGWTLATAGPIVVAALLWRSAKRCSVPWLLHLLLLPSLYALLVVGIRLMLSTLVVPDFDDTMGAPIMPALLVDAGTIIVYLSALGLRHVGARRSLARDR